MYRVNVLTEGRYHNVRLGMRYFFLKRRAKQFIKLLGEFDCAFTVEHLCIVTFNKWSAVRGEELKDRVAEGR